MLDLAAALGGGDTLICMCLEGESLFICARIALAFRWLVQRHDLARAYLGYYIYLKLGRPVLAFAEGI